MSELLTRLFISTATHKVIASDIKVRTIWETYILRNASNFDIGTVNRTQQFGKCGKCGNSHCFRYECRKHLKKHIFPLMLPILRSEPLTRLVICTTARKVIASDINFGTIWGKTFWEMLPILTSEPLITLLYNFPLYVSNLNNNSLFNAVLEHFSNVPPKYGARHLRR